MFVRYTIVHSLVIEKKIPPMALCAGLCSHANWHLKSLVPRRAVLPSLPWVVRFLSFCHWHYHRYTKKKRYVMTLRVLDG